MTIICKKCGKENRGKSKFCRICGYTLQTASPGGDLNEGVLLENRYKIISLLSSSEMSAVYKAMVIKLESICVIKELIPTGSLKEQAETVEWLRREAKILARLDHPSIPKVFDYFVNKGRYYLAMNYIEGINTETILEREGNPGLPEKKIISWTKEILKVLSYLHNQKPPIIYRDLKPSNVMLHKDGRLMLIDFGIARMIKKDSADAPKTVIGTDGYAPLEQYQGKPDARSDIYALGATMHHFLSGVMPAPLGLEPLKEILSNVSPDLDYIVMKALSDKPENRFSSAEEMLDELNSKFPPPSAIKGAPTNKLYKSLLSNWGKIFRSIIFNKAFRCVSFKDLEHGWITGDGGTLLHGTGAGGKWSLQKAGTYKNLYCSHFINEKKGWVAGEKGTLLYTLNGGDGWKKIGHITDKDLYDIYFVDEKKGWIAGEKGIVLYTENGGRPSDVKGEVSNWEKVECNTLYNLYSIYFTSKNTGIITGEKGLVLRTEDEGITWKKQTVSDATLMKVQFVNHKKGWITGEGGVILHTKDGGITWKEQYSNPLTYFSDLSFVDDENGWIVGTHLKKGEIILNTSDGGDSWEILETGKSARPLMGVHFLDIHNGWVVTCDGKVLYTNTGGISWKIQYK